MIVKIKNSEYIFRLPLDKFVKDYDLTLSQWALACEQVYGYKDYLVMQSILIELINKYDLSEKVNSFTYNDKSYWFSKADRVGLRNLANSCDSKVDVFLDDVVSFDKDKFESFLDSLEIYAGKCYINTLKYLKLANEAENVDALLAIDYKKGYPRKIVLQ